MQTVKIPTLTVRQPWAGLIERGIKKLEVRQWVTPHRGPLLITSSSTISRTEAGLNFAHDDMALGQSIVFVDLVKVRLGMGVDEPDALVSPIGHWVFELADPVPAPRVPVKGKLNVWGLDARHPALVEAWWTYVERRGRVEPVTTPNMETTWAIRMPKLLRERCEAAGRQATRGTGYNYTDWVRRILDEASAAELGTEKVIDDE